MPKRTNSKITNKQQDKANNKETREKIANNNNKKALRDNRREDRNQEKEEGVEELKEEDANSSDDKVAASPTGSLLTDSSTVPRTNTSSMTNYDLISVPNADTLRFFKVCNLGKVTITAGNAISQDTIPIILNGTRLLNLVLCLWVFWTKDTRPDLIVQIHNGQCGWADKLVL